MSDSEELGLSVRPEQVWCSDHYRTIPPIVDPVVATYALVGQLLKTRKFQILCGLDEATGRKADSRLAQEKMDEISPVCCYIGDGGVQAAMVGLKSKQRAYENGHVETG